jgi:hypothetical protein
VGILILSRSCSGRRPFTLSVEGWWALFLQMFVFLRLSAIQTNVGH